MSEKNERLSILRAYIGLIIKENKCKSENELLTRVLGILQEGEDKNAYKENRVRCVNK